MFNSINGKIMTALALVAIGCACCFVAGSANISANELRALRGMDVDTTSITGSCADYNNGDNWDCHLTTSANKKPCTACTKLNFQFYVEKIGSSIPERVVKQLTTNNKNCGTQEVFKCVFDTATKKYKCDPTKTENTTTTKCSDPGYLLNPQAN